MARNIELLNTWVIKFAECHQLENENKMGKGLMNTWSEFLDIPALAVLSQSIFCKQTENKLCDRFNGPTFVGLRHDSSACRLCFLHRPRVHFN